jgi:chlorite dismutase
MAQRFLNLYSIYSFLPEFWALTPEERKAVRGQIAQEAAAVAGATHLYNVFPARADWDFLIWSAWESDEGAIAKEAFHGFSKAVEGWRRYVRPVQTFWGFTRASMYSRGKSEQDMDPFDSFRTAFLVIYPFSKTKEWYLMSMDARQGMMNEHIKIGKQYFDVKQLLLYSFGLQDQEFVVSYEIEDLTRFSDLVNNLRDTEGRRYTLLDTPIITALYRTPEEFAG